MNAFLQGISRDIREVKSRVQTHVEEKDSMMGEHQDFMKQKAKLELNIADLTGEVEGESSLKVCCMWGVCNDGSFKKLGVVMSVSPKKSLYKFLKDMKGDHLNVPIPAYRILSNRSPGA